jgi:hypothetical protein
MKESGAAQAQAEWVQSVYYDLGGYNRYHDNESDGSYAMS